MLRLLFIHLLIIGITSCASAPKSYQPLVDAKASLATLIENEKINEIASVTLFQANEELTLADTALQKNDIATVDHHIYVSLQKQQIAQELFLKKQYEVELSNLKIQHQEMITHARNLETKRAHNEAKLAKQRARKLELALGEYQAEETSRGTLLVINDLLFVTGGSRLEAESANRLNPLLQYLRGNPRREIIIEGHTDSIGTAKDNKQLSLRRAQAVKDFLTSQGIAETRIETRGFGEEVPVATNTTNAGRKLNRRVEVIIKTIVQEDL